MRFSWRSTSEPGRKRLRTQGIQSGTSAFKRTGQGSPAASRLKRRDYDRTVGRRAQPEGVFSVVAGVGAEFVQDHLVQLPVCLAITPVAGSEVLPARPVAQGNPLHPSGIGLPLTRRDGLHS